MTIAVDIQKSYPKFTLDVAFDAGPGVTAIFGPSGSGKTSLINAIAGLLDPTDGCISVDGLRLFDRKDGTNLPPHKRRMGYVFQDNRLFPHLSVRQNLTYSPRNTASAAELDTVVQLLGLEALLGRAPRNLSGGEAQRVAIGRALLSSPQSLLLDEPLASLDADRKAEILPYLQRMRDALKIPILYVSHALDEVIELADNLALISAGRLMAFGPLETVLADPEAAPYLGAHGETSLLPATVTRHDDDGLTELATAVGPLLVPRMMAEVGATTRIRIEADDVILSRTAPEGLSALNVLPVRVSNCFDHQAGVMVHLDAGGSDLRARITSRSARALNLAPGDPIFAIVKARRLNQPSA